MSPGRVDHEFIDINAMAAVIGGSISAELEGCFMTMTALPFGSTLHCYRPC